MEFAYDGGGLGKGGDVDLFVDGDKVGEGRVEMTVPMVFSADETTDVGSDSGTPVSDDVDPNATEFTGTVRWVQLDIDEAAEDLDHLITPRSASGSRWRGKSSPGVPNRMEWSLAIVALTLLGVAAVSRRLSGTPVTPAIVFVAVGLLVGPEVLDGIDLESSSATVRTLAEATLALVLFCDASRIDLGLLRREVGVPLRLLGIGLPLTIALGAVAAAVIFDQLTIAEAVILAISGADRRRAGAGGGHRAAHPGRIRQGLNVESGLNDGICVPLLFAAVAVADVESEISEGRSAATLLLEEIGYGVVGGVVGGLVVAAIVIHAGRRDLIAARGGR